MMVIIIIVAIVSYVNQGMFLFALLTDYIINISGIMFQTWFALSSSAILRLSSLRDFSSGISILSGRFKQQLKSMVTDCEFLVKLKILFVSDCTLVILLKALHYVYSLNTVFSTVVKIVRVSTIYGNKQGSETITSHASNFSIIGVKGGRINIRT